MTSWKILVTKKSPHIYGHIYEHLFCNRFNNSALASKKICPIEYLTLGYTDDDNIIIGLEGFSRWSFYKNQKTPFSIDEIKIAIDQISAEYKREYVIKDENLLISEINNLSSKKWQNIRTLLPQKSTYEKDIYHSKSLDFKPKNKNNFVDFVISYELSKKFSDLSPLAVYIFGALQLTINDLFYKNYGCFDFLAEYSPHNPFPQDPALRQINGLTFHKSTFQTNKAFRAVFDQYLDEVINDFRLIEKLTKYLQKTSVIDMNFSYQDINDYTGWLVGKKGWRKLATTENIEIILKNMQITTKIV